MSPSADGSAEGSAGATAGVLAIAEADDGTTEVNNVEREAGADAEAEVTTAAAWLED